MIKPFFSILVVDESGNMISELPLDVRKNSTETYNATVTDSPVESGYTISDHVRLLPEEISVEGFVSSVPPESVPLAGDLGGDMGPGSEPSPEVLDAFAAIMKVYQARQVVTVVSGLSVYPNMVINHVEFPRSVEQGLGLWFSMTLRRLIVVSTLSASLPDAVIKKLKALKKARAKPDPKAQQAMATLKKGRADQAPVTDPGIKGTAGGAAANFP